MQQLAVATAAMEGLARNGRAARPLHPGGLGPGLATMSSSDVDIEGHTLVGQFKLDGIAWKVHEDLRTRDGTITFLSSQGAARVLTKSAEAAFEEADSSFLGLKIEDIGMSGPDLLADRLLRKGDPDPKLVKSAAPPQGSARREGQRFPRYRWDAFVGTKECNDNMMVYPNGNTRTYHPNQVFPEITSEAASKRYNGMVGGWMPCVRKVYPKSDTAYHEVLVFGDVEATDKFIVQTWHRTALIQNGKIVKAVYGYSYPPFPPARQNPPAEDFYRALLVFAAYWDRLLEDFVPTELPDNDWVDMSKHAFAKEIMVRPDGVYPKYGAIDRDYYGPEYDGFQDIFTMSAYTNLEWGRFEPVRKIIDNYFDDFVDSKGVNDMRGPEVAQFGMTLSLMARHFHYTGDSDLLVKHRGKIEATAAVLTALHDESLKLPKDDIGYGIIHGWSESDACLHPDPAVWWLPYFANNAYSSRGLKDIAQVWPTVNRGHSGAGVERTARDWLERSKVLQDTLIASMRKDVRKDMNPPYIGVFPGTKLQFRESMEKERPSPQQWTHRAFAELLQADALPHDLANIVCDCMRAYGSTTIGVTANVGRPRSTGRSILGFISYGHAQMLLRLDRVEEFLLFLYAHRYHDHTRGSWVAGEVSGITGGTALFCIPAQQTIPLLVRWMLVLEDSDEDRLYLGKGLPRDWVGSGKVCQIRHAPTRWGRVNFSLQAQPANKAVVGRVELARAGAPGELQVKFRLPAGQTLREVTVNGRPAAFSGVQGDVVAFETRNEKIFEVVVQYA
jgi:hypothetical protein